MKLNRKWMLVVALVLSVAMATSGTLAYLTSEDADVNVMTLGNVKIEQHEYERATNADGSYKTAEFDNQKSYVLQGFTQAKDLLPIVGDPSEPGDSPAYAGWDDITVRMSQVDSYGGMQVFAGKNAQDKFVTVENTGKTDAYVRTIVAIEVGSADADLIGTSYHGTWTTNEPMIAKIDDYTYIVTEYVYAGGQLSDGSWRHENGILPAGDTSYPNLSQVYLKSKATNEDMVAIDENGDGTLEIKVLSQAVQAAGFENAQTALDTAFGDVTDANVQKWFGEFAPVYNVSTLAEFQTALDEAVDGTTINLMADITGDVTVTQKPDVKLTIDGTNKTYAGVITVNGKSARYETAGVTIKNINFKADSISKDACIRLGGDDSMRYTNNVTVENCTFDVPGKVGIKSYTGGDWNLTVDGCTAKAGTHSLVQVTNVEKGLKITDCKVYSKNGINLNNTPSLYMSDCEFDTVGYCVRVGVNGNANNADIDILKSTLKSANDDSDAVIVFRGTVGAEASLDLTDTNVTGAEGITITGIDDTQITK